MGGAAVSFGGIAIVLCCESPPSFGDAVLRDGSAVIGVSAASDAMGRGAGLGGGTEGDRLSILAGASAMTASSSLPGPLALGSAFSVGAGATVATVCGFAGMS